MAFSGYGVNAEPAANEPGTAMARFSTAEDSAATGIDRRSLPGRASGKDAFNLPILTPNVISGKKK
jgi:hypothetical protein